MGFYQIEKHIGSYERRNLWLVNNYASLASQLYKCAEMFDLLNNMWQFFRDVHVLWFNTTSLKDR